MRRRSSVFAVLARLLVFSALSALGACYGDGHDYSVTSTWLINGATPDATRCSELGIARFRLTMDGPGAPSKLEADCTQTLRIDPNTYGGFETTRAFDYGASYAYKVEALDTKGTVIYGYSSSVTAYAGDYVPVDLDTVDVFEPNGKTASCSAAWVFTSGDLANDCATNKVDKVEIWVASVTDPDFFDAKVLSSSACTEGTFTSDGKVLSRGNFLFKYVALDARGAVAEESDAIAQDIVAPSDVPLPRHQFKGL